MPIQQKRSYLFVLETPTLEARRQAVERLKELGLVVVAQFGRSAIEAKASDTQIEGARRLGLFSAVLKGPMASEHLTKLGEDQRPILELWNMRFTSDYRELARDRTHDGKPWNAEGMEPPAGGGVIDPEDFLELVAEYERRTGERLADPASGREAPTPKLESAKQFAEFERLLADTYKDPTIGYHLARLGYRLDPRWRPTLLKLPIGLIEELLDRYFGEASCWELTGEISVGIVFVESSRPNGPKFSQAERNKITQEILDGHSLLTAEHPSGNLSWVYDFQSVKIDVANGSDDDKEPYWRNPAMAEVAFDGNSYSASWAAVAEYREHMRDANRSAHALVIFVTRYATYWHAYASSGRVTLCDRKDWGGWGMSGLDRITAHETCHLFGAADEYTGDGTPCTTCASVHGCDKIPNGNCGECASPQQDCIMGGNHRRLCNYTRGQIGWATLFVETRTSDVQWAGTDDTVWVDIGDRVFELDTPDHNDRERNNTEGYAIWAPQLRRSDIKRILIRKSPDGLSGGWRLRRVRAWFQGELVCEANGINRWLKDDHRIWVGCITDDALVNSLRVQITTADVSWAGTDDDVTLTLGDRNWDLDNSGRNDFERGNTDTFDLDPGTAFYRSAIQSVRIHKSSDGIAGGWRLKGVKVIVNGDTLFDNQSINKWLEDDHRTWSESI